MKITNEFTVHTPIERAWQVLTDLEGIAPCMPGAQLTGVEGDTYQGKVKVKVGPVISEFAGTARFAEKDEAGYRAVIDAKGRDARAGGNASALVTAVLTPAGSSTAVSVDTDLKISGKLAQFGSGMIKEVSGKLLAQFVSNLEAKLATEEPAPPATDRTEPVAAEDAASAAAGEAAPSAGSAAPAAAGDATSAETAAPSAAAKDTPAEKAEPAAAREAAAAAAEEAAPVTGSSTASNGAVPTLSDGAVPKANGALRASAPTSAPAPAPSASGPAAASARGMTEEVEPVDLLSVAGSSFYKRVIPVVVGLIVVGAVIVWVVARR